MGAMPEVFPISDLRVNQAEVLERLQVDPILLTHHGKAAAVMVSPERWNELQELIEDMSDTIAALEAKIEVLTGQDELVPWEQSKAERASVSN